MKLVTNTIPLLGPVTGVGNYIKSLLIEFIRLRPDLTYRYYYGYFSKYLKDGHETYFYSLIKSLKKIPCLYQSLRHVKHLLAYSSLKTYDIYFEPNFIPLDIKAKSTVTTVHDFSFHLYPEWLPNDRREYFSANFFKRLDKSDLIITVSDYIRNEALEILNIGNDRIVTIPSGYNKKIFYRKTTDGSAKKNYILYVGTLEPRKNLLNLLKAYLQLPAYIRRDYKLLLAGFEGWKNREIMELLQKSKGSVRYLGYVSDEMLADLYRNAACFVFPSRYEGFGMPPLEAMACGCPVITSNISSLPEVCGDAAYLVDPKDVENISAGIEDVLTNSGLNSVLVNKGYKWIKAFSWEKSAREHLRIFEKIAGIGSWD